MCMGVYIYTPLHRLASENESLCIHYKKIKNK